jgi:hypothetical protein
VTCNFTINAGLRYDLDEPRWELNNRQNGFDPTEINPVSGTPGVITFSGVGTSKYASRWDKNNFGPRLGFAWNPASKWVVRGGGAVLFLPEYDQAIPIVANTGFSTQASYISPDNGVTPAFVLGNGFPGAATPAVSQLTPGFGAVPVGSRPTTTIHTLIRTASMDTCIRLASMYSVNSAGSYSWISATWERSDTICRRLIRKASTRCHTACWA